MLSISRLLNCMCNSIFGRVVLSLPLLTKQLNARLRRSVRILNMIRVTGRRLVGARLVGVCPCCPWGVSFVSANRLVFEAATV